MPLVYKEVQSTLATKDGEKLYYPRLVKMGNVVETQKVGDLIAEKSSLTPGDVHNVIRNLTTVLRELLLNSRSVKLDGLGTFTMIASCKGKGVKTKKEVNSSQIVNLRCRFTPEYKRPNGAAVTRALTEGVEYVKLSDLISMAAANDDENETPNPGGDDGGGDFIDPSA